MDECKKIIYYFYEQVEWYKTQLIAKEHIQNEKNDFLKGYPHVVKLKVIRLMSLQPAIVCIMFNKMSIIFTF